MKLLALIPVLLLPLLLACSPKEAHQYTAEEANQLLITAFAAKDLECGSSHYLTTFVPVDINQDELDVCVSAIIASDCTTWNTDTDPTPAVCLFLSLDLS